MVRKALVKAQAKASSAPVAISVRINNIKERIAHVKSPVKKAALKSQLKAAKKVAVLSKALKKAESEEKKAVIVKKLTKARKHLKKATKKVQKVFAGSKSKHNPADDLTSDTE